MFFLGPYDVFLGLEPGLWPLLTHLSTVCLPRVFLQADLNTNIEDEGSSFYGVSSQYESPENMIITCSTKVCSFGKQVVEKVEVGAHPVRLFNQALRRFSLAFILVPTSFSRFV